MAPIQTAPDRATLAAALVSRRAQRREGAVMMVVLLVLMVATASAAVSIRSTQSEIQSAGQNRLAAQSHYASEAAMNSVFAYVDRIDKDLWCVWQKANAAPAPTMVVYGEPEFGGASRRNVARVWAANVAGIQDPLLDERAALSNAQPSPNSGSGGTAASSGGGGTSGSSGSDLLGSFGPRQAYGVPSGDDAFAVDFTDCSPAPAAMNPGGQLNGPSGSPTEQRYFCTLTAHARLQTEGAASTRAWTFGSVEYKQDRSVRVHDARATILTPALTPIPCL
jgi:hypothetical protein